MAYSIAYYIALTVYQIVDAYYTGPRDILIQTMIILLVGLGLEIWTLYWTEMVAYGAYQEVKSGSRIWAKLVEQVNSGMA